jgi:tetratricopeptide (TPR) repeat protein
MTRRFMPFVAFCILSCGRHDQTPADPGAILTARTLGLAYIEENRLPEAEAQFLTLIRLVPDEPSGYANLGLVYLRLGRYEDAQQRIDHAVKLAPDDPDIRLLQATALLIRGRPDDARHTLDASLKTSPAHLKTLYALAQLDSGGGRGSGGGSERYLQRVVDAAPANVPARLAYAEALLRQGAITEAREQLELLRQRLPSVPSQAERFYNAAVTSVQANRGEEARDNLTRARAFLETTAVYQAGMAELRSPAGVPPGYPVLTLSPRLTLLQRDPQAVVKALRFTQVSRAVTTPLTRGIAAGDYDNDGHLDFFDGALHHNKGDDTFEASTAIAAADAVTAVFADLDHDGDLDLFVGAAPEGGGPTDSIGTTATARSRRWRRASGCPARAPPARHLGTSTTTRESTSL